MDYKTTSGSERVKRDGDCPIQYRSWVPSDTSDSTSRFQAPNKNTGITEFFMQYEVKLLNPSHKTLWMLKVYEQKIDGLT